MSIQTALRLQPAAAPATAGPARGATTSPSGAFTATLHEGFEPVAAVWRAFQEQGGCTAYQRLDWAQGIAATIMPHDRARPLVVGIVERSSGRTVMLLPFAITRRAAHLAVTWLDSGVCDYAAPLLAPEVDLTPAEAADAWSAALAVLPRADLIRVSRIPAAIGARANPLATLPVARAMALQSFGLPISGPPETLLKRLCSASANHNLRRYDKRLAKEGAVRFVVASSPGEVDTLFEALMDQRRQRFRDLGRVDLLDRPEVRAFYRDAAGRGLQGGPARLFGLAVGDKWIATALGLVHGGAFHGILLAMDSQWRSFSPGLRIATEIMVWSRREGLGFFDLTIGDLPYKASLGASPHTLHEIAMGTSLRGRLILAGSRAVVEAKAWLQARPQLFEPVRALRQRVRRWTSRVKDLTGGAPG